jgi:DNA topoisomerase III
MKKLVLAEKPSVGRDIAKVLNCHQKGNGCLEGNDYIVTWALGHLVTLADPEQYDDKFKTWRLEDLPIMPNRMELTVIPNTSKQYHAVKKLMLRQDVKEIIIATDAGREGELVARWIIEKANVRKPIKRLWISSVTDKAIRDGFKQLKDGRLYNRLYASAEARSEADWVVGINATRALTTKYNAQLSCGRVQTPTLALIAKREEEIRQFKPKTYYGLRALTSGLQLTWQDHNKQNRTFQENKVDQLLSSLQGKKAEIIDLNKSVKKSYAPALYDLTELQRDANKRYNYSAKETLKIMQGLYEHHKVLTYPRTDSRYLTSDIVPTLKERLDACLNSSFKSTVSKLLRTPIKGKPSFVNDAKVSDHHAIIPTEERPNFMKMNDRERHIYDLVVKRFLAVLMPPYEYEQLTIFAKVGNEDFLAKGKRVLSLGWKELDQSQYDDDDQDDQNLPDVKKGDCLTVTQLQKTSGETQPPAYFTEASLLSAMENPKPYMETNNQALLKTIGETGGLGTVATRADIIEKLFNSFLIEKKGNHIFTTSKGKQLLELVPEALRSPDLTAKWELQLSQIANDKLDKSVFLSEMREFAVKNVHEIKNSKEKFKHDNLTGKTCPDCGKHLLEVSNKNNKMLVCQDRGCGYRKVTSQTTNTRCPNCHKKLELFGEGEGRVFICPCGHKEKFSTFQNRKKDEKKTLSKQDARRYMAKEQNKDEPINTGLFDALKNLKL